MVIGSIPTGFPTVVNRCFTQIGAGGGFSVRAVGAAAFAEPCELGLAGDT